MLRTRNRAPRDSQAQTGAALHGLRVLAALVDPAAEVQENLLYAAEKAVMRAAGA